jgi:glyoxylase-like metal-dependent hydrolase (beta-lactamase superfamily II)
MRLGFIAAVNHGRQPSRLVAAALLAFAQVTGAISAPPVREDNAAPHDWYHIVKIDARTYALSEPKYWQRNVSYLILGSKQALLFDTGPGIYSIRDLVQRLTSLPVMVVPSHLHFDHVGRISEFTDIALLDKRELRRQLKDGIFTETRAQYMLDNDYSFSVHRWIKNGETIDLGGRQITVVSTPGHTPESVSLIDPSNRRMFTGDLVNREVLLLNVPGSSLYQALWSLRELARVAPKGSVAYEAHSEQPLLAAELQLIARGIDEIVHGRVHAEPVCLGGVPALRYDVRSFPIVFPDAADARLRPLMSVTDTFDLTPGESCRLGKS